MRQSDSARSDSGRKPLKSHTHPRVGPLIANQPAQPSGRPFRTILAGGVPRFSRARRCRLSAGVVCRCAGRFRP